MNLFLIGFMGCGKSTIGKHLADHLQKKLIDLDAFIEAQQQKKITEIFASDGEAAFRLIEHDALLDVSRSGNQIVSVGGGAPCFHNNMQWMNQNGITIYLKLSAKALTERLNSLPKHARDSRPLIANKTKEELYDFICIMLEKREHFYNQSKLIVMNEEADPAIAIGRISTALKYTN
jgi:shikimate kinase